MEAYKASSSSANGGEPSPCEYSSSLQVLQDWDMSLRLEGYDSKFKPILDKFNRDTKATFNHLLVVHNETCACQIDCASEMNKIWNQKKVPFMELHKLSGLGFEDFLSRILRLLLTNPITNIEPLSETEFWMHLRHQNQFPRNQGEPCSTTSVPGVQKQETIDDEELNDIQNFILNDIVKVNHTPSLPTTTMPQQAAQPPMPSPIDQPLISSPAADFVDELAKLKRKEKHMAPIDCTGVSAAFGLTWFCKHCSQTHSSKLECTYYKAFHYTKFVIENLSVKDELPHELCVNGLGSISTSKHASLKAFTRLGPLNGQVLDESLMDFDEDRRNVWLLYCENGTRKCVVPKNWGRLVTPAESMEEANCLVISSKDKLFLVTSVDIPAGTPLKFFAKEDPTTEFWTNWTNAWANQKKCSRCSVHGKFSSVADYRVHISLWHDLSFQGNPQNRIYYCPDCNSKHIGAKEIVRHCKEAHETLPFHCRHCSKRFETYNSLIKHKNRIHSAEKPLRKTCPHCAKVYLDPKALKQHVKQVHEKSEQLHCNHCERILSSKYALNRHVKEVHEKQQEHICVKCKKHFTQQSNLKQHMLIHLGVKPFACQHGNGCRSAFTTKQTLQVHYRKVHRYTDETMPPAVKRIKVEDVLSSAQATSSTSRDEFPQACTGSTTRNRSVFY